MSTATATAGTISQEDVNELCAKAMVFSDQLCGTSLFRYQKLVFLRIFEALVIGEGAELTVLQSRQSGKTEATARAIAAAMILLPMLAKVEKYSKLLARYKTGLMVGVFAPTDDQSRIIHSRVADQLTSTAGKRMLAEIGLTVTGAGDRGVGRLVQLSNGSLIRRQTASPKAKIEGTSYHLILIDEAQDVDDRVIAKSIVPMLAFYNGTRVLTGTPTVVKGYFYNAIASGKRAQTKPGSRQMHYEAPWQSCAEENPDYAAFVENEKLRIGEDSDEFQMAFNLRWMLTRGLFVPQGRMDHRDQRFLGDVSMDLIHEYRRSPIVLGIDPARTTDSTVVTALWVNWHRQDPFGNREVRILNWMELTNEEWEVQYRKIMQFASNYDVGRVRVDAQGMGSAVAERIKLLMGPRVQVEGVPSDTVNQEKRWKALLELLERNLISWPASGNARKARRYRRFTQQMDELEKHYVQGRMIARAPNGGDAHDDYPDSLALACIGAVGDTVAQVQVMANPFTAHRRRRG